jgi:hypothetical protein
MLKIVLAPKIINMLDELQSIIKEHHEFLIKEFSVFLTPKDYTGGKHMETLKNLKKYKFYRKVLRIKL